MARIKIKQLNERVATMGLHMGGDARRRKLQPGEVVEIPDDMVEDGEVLIDVLFATNTIDLTRDAPTRPLDYASIAEAKLCSPTFKPNDPSEERESEKARERVAARLAEQFAEDEKSPGKKSAKQADTPATEEPKKQGSRRALRRQALDMKDGEAATA